MCRKTILSLLTLGLATVLLFGPGSNSAGEKVRRGEETAAFGAGCFWGVEEAFRNVPGVTETEAGYMGGTAIDPTYEEVCNGGTGHAEVVQVTYDPSRVTYEALLEVFWKIHDPTDANSRGADGVSQYRSVIFYHSPEQEREAKASMDEVQASGKYRKEIATRIEPAGDFWPAEEYHQLYYQKKGIISFSP